MRNGAALTTAAVCSNHGSIPGTIGAQFFQFNGTSVCTVAYGNVGPGETRTLAVEPIASMVTGQACSGAPVINQGRVEVYANTAETLKFVCTIMLIDKSNNPPLNMTRLNLYSGTGVTPGDIFFSDGVDP